SGGTGNNTYLFGRGDGQDFILPSPSDTSAGKLNTLQLKAGVAPGDVTLRRAFDLNTAKDSALEVAIAGTTDKVVVSNFLTGDDPGNGLNPVQQIRFGDGTVWSRA